MSYAWKIGPGLRNGAVPRNAALADLQFAGATNNPGVFQVKSASQIKVVDFHGLRGLQVERRPGESGPSGPRAEVTNYNDYLTTSIGFDSSVKVLFRTQRFVILRATSSGNTFMQWHQSGTSLGHPPCHYEYDSGAKAIKCHVYLPGNDQTTLLSGVGTGEVIDIEVEYGASNGQGGYIINRARQFPLADLAEPGKWPALAVAGKRFSGVTVQSSDQLYLKVGAYCYRDSDFLVVFLGDYCAHGAGARGEANNLWMDSVGKPNLPPEPNPIPDPPPPPPPEPDPDPPPPPTGDDPLTVLLNKIYGRAEGIRNRLIGAPPSWDGGVDEWPNGTRMTDARRKTAATDPGRSAEEIRKLIAAYRETGD